MGDWFIVLRFPLVTDDILYRFWIVGFRQDVVLVLEELSEFVDEEACIRGLKLSAVLYV